MKRGTTACAVLVSAMVACSGDDATFEHTRATYPQVRCVQLPEKALPGEARNAGLWMARGEYVTFPGSHVWLRPGSRAARLQAHDDGWDLVTGSVVNAAARLQTAAAPGEVLAGLTTHELTRESVSFGARREVVAVGDDTKK